jgi:hypothetical protein
MPVMPVYNLVPGRVLGVAVKDAHGGWAIATGVPRRRPGRPAW